MKFMLLVFFISTFAFSAEWQQVSTHEGFMNQYHYLSCDEVNHRILVGTLAGFRYYDIDSDQWFEEEIPGLFGVEKYAIKGCGILHPNRIVLGCATANFLGFVSVSDAQGDSLGKVFVGGSNLAPAVVRDVEIDQFNPGTLYGCSWSDGAQPGSFIVSTDSGETWELTYPSNIPHGLTNIEIASNGDIYLGGTNPGISKSTDNGISWTVITNGLPAGTWGQALATDPSDSLRVLFGTQYGLYETVNGGSSWDQILAPYCYSIAFSSENPMMVAVGTNDARVWVSSDGGSSWFDKTGNLPPEAQSQDISGLAFSSTDGYLYVSTRNTGIYRTVTNALSVTDENISINPQEELIPLTISPNPVIQHTNINYTINTMSFVNLDILDMSGRIIENVLQETIPAGFHTIPWNTADYPAGTYLIRLVTQFGSSQESMVVIK